jgi:hypothetical protein
MLIALLFHALDSVDRYYHLHTVVQMKEGLHKSMFGTRRHRVRKDKGRERVGVAHGTPVPATAEAEAALAVALAQQFRNPSEVIQVAERRIMEGLASDGTLVETSAGISADIENDATGNIEQTDAMQRASNTEDELELERSSIASPFEGELQEAIVNSQSLTLDVDVANIQSSVDKAAVAEAARVATVEAFSDDWPDDSCVAVKVCTSLMRRREDSL